MEPNDHKISNSDLSVQAYNALTGFFFSHEDEVVEIEMLPPAIQPLEGLVMQDGHNLGIPKKVLVAAYIQARQLFFEGIEGGATSLQTLQASRVMLLFDPEHITVANYRKRRILKIREDGTGGLAFEEAIMQETVFLDSILTSPLHRQSKSPTLWHHRAWLLEILVPIKLVDPSGEELMIFLRSELNSVLKAGERHPKNYYAFQYARRLLTQSDIIYTNETSHAWKATYPEFLIKCTLLVKAWCCMHPSDISGWSFLLFLLPRLESVSTRQEIVSQVLDYALRLQAKQVSVWVFICTALVEHFPDGERDALVRRLHKFQQQQAHTTGDVSFEDPVTQALKRIKVHSNVLPNPKHPQILNAG